MSITRAQAPVAVLALVLALAGVGVAGYLAIENLRGGTGVCVGVHGCATVQESRYGKLFGVPVSVPGLVLYVLLTAGALAFLFERLATRTEVAFLAFLGALSGFLFSGYLTYVEAFVLHAWCSYCIASALLMTGLLAAWSLLLYLSMRPQPPPETQERSSSPDDARASRAQA